MTTKRLLIIALAFGAIVSAALMMIDPLVNFSLLSWQMPGATAAYLFWGMIGASTAVGITVAWFVNAIVYGAGVFALLGVIRQLTQAK